MKPLSRREALAILASAPFASLSVSSTEAARAQRATAGDYTPKFFTGHELDTVRLLVDLLIPADERSGSASDVGVPEFMDFLMDDQPERRTAMRGGLAWIDVEFLERFDRRFVDGSDAERRELLDVICYPERAPEELSHGVAFMNAFRDLTATGFFTSKTGFEDLEFKGNEHLTEWTGCPPEALRKIGLE